MPHNAGSPGSPLDRLQAAREGSRQAALAEDPPTQPRARQAASRGNDPVPARGPSARTPLDQRREARQRRRNEDGVLLSFARKAPNGKRGEIRVAVVPYAGRELLHIRHYEPSPSGFWVATQRGVTIPLNQIAALRHALEQAEEIMHAAEAERDAGDVLEDDEP